MQCVLAQLLLLSCQDLQAAGRAGVWVLLPCTASPPHPARALGIVQELTAAAGGLGAESLNHLTLGWAPNKRRTRASVAQRAAHRTRGTWMSGIAEVAWGGRPGRLWGLRLGEWKICSGKETTQHLVF